MSHARQHAHELIDQVPEQQVSALVRLLETIVDPLAAALRSAPVEDEEMGEQELRAAAHSREWFKYNDGTPFEDMVAELGLTMEQIRNYREPA